jgi:hypothetical protein
LQATFFEVRRVTIRHPPDRAIFNLRMHGSDRSVCLRQIGSERGQRHLRRG